MDVEIDKFISLVRSYSPLWDMRDKLYHSREVQRKLWAEVAEAMDDDVLDLKKKWKGLRDSFRREFKKFMKSGQAAPDNFTSQWPYFDHMLFLSDIMQPRGIKGNASPSSSSILEIMSHPQEQDIMETNEDHLSPTIKKKSSENTSQNINLSVYHKEMGPPSHTPTKGKRKNVESGENKQEDTQIYDHKKRFNKKEALARHYDKQIFEIEKAKWKLFSENVVNKNDSEYQFLLSLLPYLKKVPQHRQLAVRNKISQVLIDEERQNDNNKGFYQPSLHASLPHTTITTPTQSTWTSGSDIGVESDIASPLSWTSEGHNNSQLVSPSWNFEPQGGTQRTLTNVASGGHHF